MKVLALIALVFLGIAPATAQPAEPLGIALEGYAYPHPVQYLSLEVQHHVVRLAYMDVVPAGPGNGRTVLLFHGRNFPASYWEPAIKALTGAGYRVIAPDDKPVLLMVGTRDRTAPGKPFAKPEDRERMGLVAERAQELAPKMKNARVEIFDGVGHLIHLEATERFNQVLLGFLAEK